MQQRVKPTELHMKQNQKVQVEANYTDTPESSVYQRRYRPRRQRELPKVKSNRFDKQNISWHFDPVDIISTNFEKTGVFAAVAVVFAKAPYYAPHFFKPHEWASLWVPADVIFDARFA